MKKTLAALMVGAFAAASANAAVVYDNDGTKVDFNGSLRLVMEKANGEGAGRAHSGLRNDGSRIKLKVTHGLSDGYYALGAFDLRFNKDSKQDGFNTVDARRAYAGFGHKEYGEVTFGRRVTIADSLSTANDYTYGLINKFDYIPTDGNSVVHYSYKGVKDLEVGASYIFANDRDDKNEVTADKLQNNYQVGVVYDTKWDDVYGVMAKFGYGRTAYKAAGAQEHYKDGFLASLGYSYNDFLLSVDGGYAKEKVTGQKVSRYFVSPGFQTPITDVSNVYGNYLFEEAKTSDTEKEKRHGFLLGVDYQFHKQVVVFLEGKYQVEKSYVNNQYQNGSKVRDKAIGVGMRVFW